MLIYSLVANQLLLFTQSSFSMTIPFIFPRLVCQYAPIIYNTVTEEYKKCEIMDEAQVR